MSKREASAQTRGSNRLRGQWTSETRLPKSSARSAVGLSKGGMFKAAFSSGEFLSVYRGLVCLVERIEKDR